MENVLLDADREMTSTAKPAANGFTVPYALAAPLVALMLASLGWNFTLSGRVTSLETQATSLTSAAVEIAALKQKMSDFQEEYERDRVNDRVAEARSGK